jgi:hypothetical protein
MKSVLIALIYLALGFALGTSYNGYSNHMLRECLNGATENK